MRYIFLAITLLFAFVVKATDLKLKETWSYSVNFDQKTIKITGGKIKNNEDSGESGEITLIIFLTKKKYPIDSEDEGHVLAKTKFNSLKAGYNYYDIEKTVDFIETPATGDYYVSIILLEKIEDDFHVIDYLNFNGYMAFKNKSNDFNNNLLMQNMLFQQMLNSGGNNIYAPTNTRKVCYECQGTGRCIVCRGSGTYSLYGQTSRCSACSGTGICSRCKGSRYEAY